MLYKYSTYIAILLAKYDNSMYIIRIYKSYTVHALTCSFYIVTSHNYKKLVRKNETKGDCVFLFQLF